MTKKKDDGWVWGNKNFLCLDVSGRVEEKKMKLLKNVLFLPFCLKNWQEQFFNQFVPSFLFFFFLIVLHEYPNGKKLFLNYIYFKFLKYFLRAKHDLKRVSSP